MFDNMKDTGVAYSLVMQTELCYIHQFVFHTCILFMINTHGSGKGICQAGVSIAGCECVQ